MLSRLKSTGTNVSAAGTAIARACELLALPLLRGGRIDFEHAQAIGKRIAIRKRVQTGAEHDVLRNAARNRRGQRVLGEAAADRHERAQAPGRRGPLALVIEKRFGSLADDAQGERIGEDAGWSRIWWAARRRATRHAVRLGVPSSMPGRTRADYGVVRLFASSARNAW